MKMISLTVDREVLRCKGCHREIPFFSISGFLYAKRIVRYDKGKYFYFDFLEDEVYDGFYKTAEGMGRTLGIPLDYEQIHHIFSITIDPIDGYSVDIQTDDDRCPYCGSEHYESELVQPSNAVMVELPVVTHEHWNTLSDAQKQKRLRAAIEALR